MRVGLMFPRVTACPAAELEAMVERFAADVLPEITSRDRAST